MSAVSRLQPGCGPWLGPVARELVTSLTRLLEADLGNNNLGLGQRQPRPRHHAEVPVPGNVGDEAPGSWDLVLARGLHHHSVPVRRGGDVRQSDPGLAEAGGVPRDVRHEDAALPRLPRLGGRDHHEVCISSCTLGCGQAWTQQPRSKDEIRVFFMIGDLRHSAKKSTTEDPNTLNNP